MQVRFSKFSILAPSSKMIATPFHDKNSEQSPSIKILNNVCVWMCECLTPSAPRARAFAMSVPLWTPPSWITSTWTRPIRGWRLNDRDLHLAQQPFWWLPTRLSWPDWGIQIWFQIKNFPLFSVLLCSVEHRVDLKNLPLTNLPRVQLATSVVAHLRFRIA